MHTLIAALDTRLDGRHDGPDAVMKTEVSTVFNRQMHKVSANTNLFCLTQQAVV